MKQNTRLCCPCCGSDAIQIEAWLYANDDTVAAYSEGSDDPYYCDVCCKRFECVSELDVETYRPVNGTPIPDQSPTFTPEAVDVERVEAAQHLLKRALELLKLAGTPKSAARVRLALSSVRGALGNSHIRINAAKAGRPRKRIMRAPRVEIINIRR